MNFDTYQIRIIKQKIPLFLYYFLIYFLSYFINIVFLGQIANNSHRNNFINFVANFPIKAPRFAINCK